MKREIDTFMHHQTRINRAKADIDCHNGGRPKHLDMNLKKQAMATLRSEEIERADAHLRSRMESYRPGPSGGCQPCKNRKTRSLARGEMVPPKSMNKHVRTKELKRIREENQRMAKRMNNLRPTSELSQSSMLKDKLRRDRYLDNISKSRQQAKKFEAMQKRILSDSNSTGRNTKANSYFHPKHSKSKGGKGGASLPSLHSPSDARYLGSSFSTSHLPPIQGGMGAHSLNSSKQVRFE